MHVKLVSVIVAVKDDAAGLERTLVSITNQPNIAEIIVIDGGSTDGSVDIVRAYQAQIHFWETGLDSGISDAFNRGIAHSTGDLVAILNAGDEWYPDILPRISDAAEQHPQVIIHGSIEFLRPGGHPSHVIRPESGRLARRMSVFHPTLFVPRTVYSEVGEYSTSYQYAMDCEWVHRAVQYGVGFHEIQGPLARMELGGRSDIRYWRSLSEYRKSVVTHGLCGSVKAGYFFFLGLFRKTVARVFLLEKIRPLRGF